MPWHVIQLFCTNGFASPSSSGCGGCGCVCRVLAKEGCRAVAEAMKQGGEVEDPHKRSVLNETHPCPTLKPLWHDSS